ncbi:MAG TPA: HAMP domain-containing sensor histidine kinase [Thermoleophilaceae bacterium]|nr:HAMP domain-containing sensor histidine kinase [Thermoleophilaceae bacterium]
MARSALILVAAAAAATVAMTAVRDLEDGLLMGLFGLVAGAVVLLVVHEFVGKRATLGGLGRQFGAGIALVIGLTLVGVALAGAAMFVSGEDAVVFSILLLFAGVLSAYAAAMIARGVMSDIERIRRGLIAVGAGEKAPPIELCADDELGELAERANSMIAKLDQRELERDLAEGARRDLIAAVSHDLRTPLASLQVLAEAIEDGMVDEATHRRYLEQMSINIRSLGNLIDDLFELSRLEAGDISWSMGQVRLDQLVEETVEAVAVQARQKGIDVQVRVDDDLAPARANPEKLQRVLFNLVQNAIRHTPDDGSVSVAAAMDGNRIEVEVADTGEGISPEDRRRVFEPFFRGGSEGSRTRSGAGLGLTICRAIIEAHGGRIWLDEEVDAGTRIRFTLPRAAPTSGQLPVLDA